MSFSSYPILQENLSYSELSETRVQILAPGLPY